MDDLFVFSALWDLSLRFRPLILQAYCKLLFDMRRIFGYFGPHMVLDAALLLLCARPGFGSQQLYVVVAIYVLPMHRRLHPLRLFCIYLNEL